jgi:hypothetical protein
MKYEILGSNEPNDYELAAIGAAITQLTAAAAPEPDHSADLSQWTDSGKLSGQGLRPARTGVRPEWKTIERLRQRAAGGFYGITGM